MSEQQASKRASNKIETASNRKHTAGEYLHIQVWGEAMGSFQSYINDEKEKAARLNAPLTTVYMRGTDSAPEFHVFEEVTNVTTRPDMIRLAARVEELRKSVKGKSVTSKRITKATDEEKGAYNDGSHVYPLFGFVTVTGQRCAVEHLAGSWSRDNPQFEVIAPDHYIFDVDGVHTLLCSNQKDVIDRINMNDLELCHCDECEPIPRLDSTLNTDSPEQEAIIAKSYAYRAAVIGQVVLSGDVLCDELESTVDSVDGSVCRWLRVIADAPETDKHGAYRAGHVLTLTAGLSDKDVTPAPSDEAFEVDDTTESANIKMPAYTYSVKLPQQSIINALESGVDGIRYWGYVAKFKDGQSWEAMLNGKCELTIVEDEANNDNRVNVRYTLNSKGIRKALDLIASKWPHHMKSLVTDDSDAETGDVLIQVAIFSDIIYG